MLHRTALAQLSRELAVQPNPASASDFSATPLYHPSLPRSFHLSLACSLFLVFHGWFPSFLLSLPTQKISAPPTPGSLSPPDFSPLPPVRPSKSSTSAPLAFIPLLPTFPLHHHQLDSSRNTFVLSTDLYKLSKRPFKAFNLNQHQHRRLSMTIDQSYPMTIITFKITTFTL